MKKSFTTIIAAFLMLTLIPCISNAKNSFSFDSGGHLNELEGDYYVGPVAIVAITYDSVSAYFYNGKAMIATGDSGWLAQNASIFSASKISNKPITVMIDGAGNIVGIKLHD